MNNLSNEQLNLLSSEALRAIQELARSHWLLNQVNRENNPERVNEANELDNRIQAILNSRLWNSRA